MYESNYLICLRCHSIESTSLTRKPLALFSYPVISSVDPLSLTGMEKKLFEDGGQFSFLKNGSYAYYAPLTDSERMNLRAGKTSNRNFFSFSYTLEKVTTCGASLSTDHYGNYAPSRLGLCQVKNLPVWPGQTFLSPMPVAVEADQPILQDSSL